MATDPAQHDAHIDRVTCADNLTFMATLPDGCCDLIVIDPPYWHGWPDRTKATANSLPDYLDDLRPRLEHMHRLLAETGTLYCHLDWHVVHYVKVLLDELFGYDNFLNEIIWAYRTGGASRQWFSRKHDTILVYAKRRGRHTFHLQRDGQFRTEGLNHDDQGRPYKTTKAGRLYFNPKGPALTDVWDLPFLSTVARERTGYPAQKPIALLQRIIRASSNPNDLVADFFCGSGTTLVAAKQLSRHYLGCDLNPHAIQIAHQRLAATHAD